MKFCVGDYSTYRITPPITKYLFIWVCGIFAENYDLAEYKEITLKEMTRKIKL